MSAPISCASVAKLVRDVADLAVVGGGLRYHALHRAAKLCEAWPEVLGLLMAAEALPGYLESTWLKTCAQHVRKALQP